MIIEGDGIILSKKRFAENDSIIAYFFREHGIISGVLKQQKKGLKAGHAFIPGNIGHGRWYGRLHTQLGKYSLEIFENIYAKNLFASGNLNYIAYITAITARALEERDPHPLIYDKMQEDLLHLSGIGKESGAELKAMLIEFELLLLRECGYGLSLDSCALSGEKGQLAYISPRSGAAATHAAAEAYASQLLPYPQYFADRNLRDNKSLAAALSINSYFLFKYEILNYEISQIRSMLINSK